MSAHNVSVLWKERAARAEALLRAAVTWDRALMDRPEDEVPEWRRDAEEYLAELGDP